MWSLAAFLLVVFGLPLLLWAPGSVPEPPDPERAAIARHESAREEIRVIGAVTRQLMHAATSVELPQEMAVAVTPASTAEPVQRTVFADGFAWTSSPLAGNSTAGDRVTFYVPLRRMNH